MAILRDAMMESILADMRLPIKAEKSTLKSHMKRYGNADRNPLWGRKGGRQG